MPNHPRETMRWKLASQKNHQMKPCTESIKWNHQLEPASQKETSPLDRYAINSLPHKSAAFVPQCELVEP